MLDFFYMGGPLFMGVITAALALMLIAAAFAIRAKDATRAAQYRRAVVQSGLLAAVLGILGQAIGLYDAMTVIEAMGGDVSPALLAGGIKVSFVATLYGLAVCALGLLIAGILSMRAGGRSVAALALCLMLPAMGTTQPASAQPSSERAAQLDSALSALHDHGLFAGALVIGDGRGGVAYQSAHGEHHGAPMTARAHAPIASINKMLMSTVALRLAADGILDLDAPVERYLGDALSEQGGWPYPGVTMRHLLTQTSGLHFLTTFNQSHPLPRGSHAIDALRLIARERPGAAFAPGERFDYDEANFVTLRAVIESASGERYDRLVRRHVFEPAGMTDARVRPAAYPLAWSVVVEASARDLVRYDHAFRTGALVPLQLVEEAESVTPLPDGEVSTYGLGRFVETYPRALVGHFGEAERAKSGLYRDRESNEAFAIIDLGAGIHRTAIITAAMAIWNDEPFELPQPRPVADVPASTLAKHVGSYSSGMGLLHITLEGDQLHLEPEGAGGSEPLIPASETVFYFGEQDLTWEFVQDESGATTGLMLQGNPQTLGEKVR